MKAILENKITGEKQTVEHHNHGFVVSKLFYEAREQMLKAIREEEITSFKVVIQNVPKRRSSRSAKSGR